MTLRRRDLLAAVSAAAIGTAVPGTAAAVSDRVNLFRNLDLPTLRVARETVQTALETMPGGETKRWSAPGVAEGSVTPLRTWKSASGHWCREYEEKIRFPNGREQRYVLVRCRSDEGQWRTTGG